MMEKLKKINRTILEMDLGLLVWGIVCNLVLLIFMKDKLLTTIGIWFGILFAMVSVYHMFITLNRALDMDEKGANKSITGAYMIRYTAFVIIIFIIMYTRVLNPLVVFLAYMGMKVTALIQPITHKFLNYIFHETDPIPQALPEDETDVEDQDGEDL